MKAYIVKTFDRCGERSSAEFDTFTEALEAYRTLEARRPVNAAWITQMMGDCADNESDGLTEEERDQL